MKSKTVRARRAGKLTLSSRSPRLNSPHPVICRNPSPYPDFRSSLLLKVILIALVALLLAAAPVQAAAFPANSQATLASAITSANGNTEADTITITANITLTAALPDITTQMTIMSPSGSRYTIQRSSTATAKFRIFTVTQGGDLTVNRLVLANGDSGNANGGAISVTKGNLTVTNSIIRNSTAGTDTGINTAFKGGGIWAQDDSGSGSGSSVSISNSSIHSNTAYDQGGGIFIQGRITFTMFGSAVYSNTTKKDGANGGGISFLNWANTPTTLTIVNSSIYGNAAAGRGGGVYAALNLAPVLAAGTGLAQVLTLRHVTITGNTASLSDQHRGNGLYATNLTITIQNSIISGNFNSGSSGNQSNCTFADMPTIGSTGGPTLAHNITGAGSTSSSPPHCNTNSDPSDPQLAASPEGSPPYYNLQLGSPARDSIPNAACRPASEGGDRDQRGRTRPNPAGGACDKGAIEYYAPPPPPPPQAPAPAPPSDDVGGGGGGGGGGDSIEEEDEYSAPPVSTCLTLDGIAAYNLSESTQCQRVNAMQIANPNIKEGDFVDAVDVWSWVMPNTQICFTAAGGSFTFIDTAAMPRTVQDLAACSMNGMTCASLDGPGMLVLLPGDPPPACVVQRPAAQAAPVSAQSLSNCMVRTQFNLNFRAAPDGEITGGVPHNATLTALERTSGWFKVDYHGERGWISAEYVDKKGTCG